jgi:hypothetical protein
VGGGGGGRIVSIMMTAKKAWTPLLPPVLDPHVLVPPGSGPDPIVRGTDPDPGPDLLFSHKCVKRTEIMPAK